MKTTLALVAMVGALPLFAAALFDAPVLRAPVLDAGAPLEVDLVGPIRQLVREAGDDPEEAPFTLVHDGRRIEVAVRVRSQSRRMFCPFPPLRWNFESGDVDGTVFEGQGKLKLVTHCRSSTRYEVDTLEEYNAYRILNLLTDVSFRVRQMRIRYVDGDQAETRWGFLIEDVDALAQRIGGEHVEPEYVAPSALAEPHATLVAVFQYLVANTDFSMTAPREGRECCHNAKLIQTDGALYSVPYDFDFSGLVNAPYAGVNPVVGSGSVRRRVYRGYCTDAATLDAAITSIQSRRQDIVRLFDETPGLEPKEAAAAIRYLDGFFERIEQRGAKTFDKCR